MGFLKGPDGIARTMLNPLEGSIGNVDLTNVTASGNVVTGNIVFQNSSKFKSASWTLVESFTNLNNYYTSGNSSVNMSQTFNYYSSNYNEFMIKLYPLALNAYQKTVTFTNIPLNSVSSGDKITIGTSWDPAPSSTIDYSYITWANLSTTGAVIHNLYTGAGDNPSISLYIYAR